MDPTSPATRLTCGRIDLRGLALQSQCNPKVAPVSDKAALLNAGLDPVEVMRTATEARLGNR